MGGPPGCQTTYEHIPMRHCSRRIARTFLEWPASVRRFLDDQHRRWPSPPGLAEGCTPGGARIPPAIVSPAPGQVALLLRGVPPEKQELSLEAESPSATAVLSWFIN